MLDYLCSDCKQHFKEVLEFMDSSDIPYFLDAHLVRGLDYYSRTVFEIFEEKPEYQNENNGSSLALAAGGRYDYLAHALSNKNLPAVGGALGVDRIVQLMMEREISIKAAKMPKIFFIQLGAAAKYKSLKIIEMFRKAHIPTIQSISKDTLKSQLRIASKLNMAYALILGQKEALENSIIVKDMDSGTQDTIAIEKVVEFVKNKLK